MKLSTLVNTIMLLAVAVSMSACGGGLDAETQAALDAIDKQADDAKAITTLLTQGTGNNWLLVKMFGDIGKFAVYYNPGDNKYYAFDTSKYTAGMTYDQFKDAGQVYSGLTKGTKTYQSYDEISSTDYTSSCCPVGQSCTSSTDGTGASTYKWTETEYGYVTHTETIYTDTNSGLVFEVGDQSSKDLEATSAAIESASTEVVKDTLINSYGLSEDRAQEVANLTSTWQNMAKSRALTKKDLVEFQSHVLGTDLATVMAAARKSAEGDSKDFNRLIKKAADLNGISPEQAKKIINTVGF